MILNCASSLKQFASRPLTLMIFFHHLNAFSLLLNPGDELHILRWTAKYWNPGSNRDSNESAPCSPCTWVHCLFQSPSRVLPFRLRSSVILWAEKKVLFNKPTRPTVACTVLQFHTTMYKHIAAILPSSLSSFLLPPSFPTVLPTFLSPNRPTNRLKMPNLVLETTNFISKYPKKPKIWKWRFLNLYEKL